MLNLDKNKKYLLACSYGPDSMALFSMLLKEGYDFEVAHVNYHYREESNVEEEGLRKYCLSNDIKIHVYDNKDVSKNNLEEKARHIRYNFFASLFDEFGFDYLLVAHNLDDFIETCYMQKNNAVFTLFYGIKENFTFNNLNIIRPLIKYSKDQLLAYCHENNVPYAIDQSNFDKKHLRNKIRLEIVSKMSLEEKLNLYERVMGINEELEELHLRIISNRDIHDVNYLKSLSDTDFNHAIHELAALSNIYQLSYSNILELQKIINSSKPNIILSYKDFSFVKEYDFVRFVNIDSIKEYSYRLIEPGVLDTPFFYLDFTKDTSNRNVTLEDYPLTIRNANGKLKIKIKDYYVTVSRLFIDWKMPVRLRKRWPVIFDKNNNPIYIPRYRKDYVVKDTDNFYVK